MTTLKTEKKTALFHSKDSNIKKANIYIHTGCLQKSFQLPELTLKVNLSTVSATLISNALYLDMVLQTRLALASDSETGV